MTSAQSYSAVMSSFMNPHSPPFPGLAPPTPAGGPSPHAQEWRPAQGQPNNSHWGNANPMFVPPPTPQQLAQHQQQQQRQQQWSSHYRQPQFLATRPARAPVPAHYSPPRHRHQDHSAPGYHAPFQFYSPSQSPAREESPVSVLGQFFRPSQPTGAKDGARDGSSRDGSSRGGSSRDGSSREPSPDGSSYVSNGTVYFPPPDADAEAPSFAAPAARGRKGSAARPPSGGAPYAGPVERRAVTHSGQRVMLLATAVNVEHAASLVRVAA